MVCRLPVLLGHLRRLALSPRSPTLQSLVMHRVLGLLCRLALSDSEAQHSDRGVGA